MKKFIIEGSDLAKVMQENRLRVEWGTIKFTPLESDEEAKAEVDDVKDAKIVDMKSAPASETKTPKRTTRK